MKKDFSTVQHRMRIQRRKANNLASVTLFTLAYGLYSARVFHLIPHTGEIFRFIKNHGSNCADAVLLASTLNYLTFKRKIASPHVDPDRSILCSVAALGTGAIYECLTAKLLNNGPFDWGDMACYAASLPFYIAASKLIRPTVKIQKSDIPILKA